MQSHKQALAGPEEAVNAPHSFNLKAGAQRHGPPHCGITKATEAAWTTICGALKEGTGIREPELFREILPLHTKTGKFKGA